MVNLKSRLLLSVPITLSVPPSGCSSVLRNVVGVCGCLRRQGAQARHSGRPQQASSRRGRRDDAGRGIWPAPRLHFLLRFPHVNLISVCAISIHCINIEWCASGKRYFAAPGSQFFRGGAQALGTPPPLGRCGGTPPSSCRGCAGGNLGDAAAPRGRAGALNRASRTFRRGALGEGRAMPREVAGLAGGREAAFQQAVHLGVQLAQAVFHVTA